MKYLILKIVYLLKFPLYLIQSITGQPFLMKRSIEDELLIVSPGGVATTMLISYVSRYVKINHAHDLDRKKHLSNSGVIGKITRSKILYIYTDPEDIKNSIIRRGWFYKQAGKLGCYKCFFDYNKRNVYFMESVKRQKELFKNIDKHNGNKILFIDYNDLWVRKKEIMDFFGIEDNDFVLNYPKRKPRNIS